MTEALQPVFRCSARADQLPPNIQMAFVPQDGGYKLTVSLNANALRGAWPELETDDGFPVLQCAVSTHDFEVQPSFQYLQRASFRAGGVVAFETGLRRTAPEGHEVRIEAEIWRDASRIGYALSRIRPDGALSTTIYEDVPWTSDDQPHAFRNPPPPATPGWKLPEAGA